MVSNGPGAIDSNENHVELLDRSGQVIASIEGSKQHVAKRLLQEIEKQLIKVSARESGIRQP